jgi:hypothetical protein
MTIRAIARRAWVLNFGSFNQLGLVVVAGYTKSLYILLRQDDLAILRGGVTRVALATGKWRMRELRYQLRRWRLVWVVAFEAICRGERLILVCFLQISAFRIVTVQAELRRGFREVEIKFLFAQFTSFVSYMTCLATRVQRGVPAAIFRNVKANIVAAQTEILFLITGRWFEQLVLVVRGMRVMTLYAIANCGRMYRTFHSSSILVRMAANA